MQSPSVTGSVKAFAVVAALAGASILASDFAEARSGRGFSFGSRGSRTFTAPPATKTAPKPAPVQKSITQPGRPSAAAATPASRPSLMRNLLLGGLIGAGLASLFGLGGGLAAFLGFALQALLIAGLVMLAISFFRNRANGNGGPAVARASAGPGHGAQPQADVYRSAVPGGMGMAAPELQITGDDYNAFERLLKQVQQAYANSDVDALGNHVTPEVLSQFAHELDDNAKRGLSNDLSEPKLLQGDLAEAWREGNVEYATVAMRYKIIDALVEQKTGRVVQGSTTDPQEVTEIWTFRRPADSGAEKWELSAIQQA